MTHLENPTYHLQIDQMKQEMIECLELRIDMLLSLSGITAASVEVKTPEEKMRDETGEQDEKSRRAKLLIAYREATGVSNRKIYEGRDWHPQTAVL